MQEIEEKLAHLERVAEDLSEVIARHEAEIDRLTHRVAMLMQREAEREAEGTGGIHMGDERPPHW